MSLIDRCRCSSSGKVLLLTLLVTLSLCLQSNVAAAASDRVSHGAALERSQVGLPAGWSGVAQGRVVSTHDGQVIEGLDVSVSSGSAIVVEHDDVTIRYNRVSHRDGANGVVVERGVTGAIVEFNDFEGHYRTQSGNSGSIGVVAYGQLDARRNHFRGGRDGLHVYGTDSQVTENWIADLHPNPGAHNDSVYVGGWNGYANVTIARNRTVAGNSGAIDLYALRGPIQGVGIVDNLIVGTGEGFGNYGGRTHTHYLSNRDVRIEGNRFTGQFAYPMVTGGGTNTAVDLARPGNTFSDNHWADTTTDLPARCGIAKDVCEGEQQDPVEAEPAPQQAPDPASTPAPLPTARDFAAACDPADVPAIRFIDVSRTNVHAPGIACLASRSIAQGTTTTTFEPAGAVTRGQAATMLAHTLEQVGVRLPDAAASSFSDTVSSTHSTPIGQLADVGVLAGRPDGSFSPSASLTRAQLSSMLVRAIEHASDSDLPRAERDYFRDTTGSAHRAAINVAAHAGLTVGVDGDRFAPSATVPRGQMATFVSRLLDLLIEEGLTSVGAE